MKKSKTKSWKKNAKKNEIKKRAKNAPHGTLSCGARCIGIT